SSTHNTRIERLWVEVGTQFVRRWRGFFFRLERLHNLERNNPQHLWLIHHLFLDTINMDCAAFQAEWNAHPISGEGHDQSPNNMRFEGQTLHGMYDDCTGIHPDIIKTFYSQRENPSSHGDGNSANEHPDRELAEEDWQDMENAVAVAHEKNFNHEPVNVPKHADPFPDEGVRRAFTLALADVQSNGLVPTGLGLLPEEWDDDTYPSFEMIKSGQNRTKDIRVALPDLVWRPRAILWGQALDILNRIMFMYDH
ncbi:hypothetical protein FPV67DRAFT_1419869, partial [Lyophyllum atratum]